MNSIFICIHVMWITFTHAVHLHSELITCPQMDEFLYDVMPDAPNFFHKMLAGTFVTVQHQYFRRKLLASSSD